MRRHASLVALVLAVSLGATACINTDPIPRSDYLLRAPVVADSGGSITPLSQPRFALRRLAVAPYLERPGLQLETAPNQIRGAQLHQWAEPLAESLGIFLRGRLAAALGEPVALGTRASAGSVEVFVEQLHGTMQGDAVIAARFVVERGRGGSEERYRFTRREALAGDGYTALVDAEKRLVESLADALARVLLPPAVPVLPPAAPADPGENAAEEDER